MIGKVLVAVGLVIALLGLLIWTGFPKGLKLGRLPGDIVIEQKGLTLFLPLTTMILISGLLTLVFWIIGAIRK